MWQTKKTKTPTLQDTPKARKYTKKDSQKRKNSKNKKKNVHYYRNTTKLKTEKKKKKKKTPQQGGGRPGATKKCQDDEVQELMKALRDGQKRFFVKAPQRMLDVF